MKALILVGGFGTRLRPLTLTKPKPLVEFCNQGIVTHQIEALVAVGVTEVVLAVSFQAQMMVEWLEEIQKKYGIKVTCSHELEPLGTAGPLALSREILSEDREPFFVFNSDVTCEYPLKELLEFHKAHGKEGTICVTRVEEPSRYGVVVHDKAGKIERFVEKPKEFVGNHINAGLYIFNPQILDRIELRPTSIERKIFPAMAEEEQLFAFTLEGYWMDIGKPGDFLVGMALHLGSLRSRSPEQLSDGPQFVGNVLVDPTAKIGESCIIGPDVVIGANCVVEEGVRLKKTTLMSNVTVKANSWIHQSIIGWDSVVGKWCRLDGVTVLGEDVSVKDELFLNGGIVLPHKSIGESIPTPAIVM